MSNNQCCRTVFRKTTSIVAGPTLNLVITQVPTPLLNGQGLQLCIAQNIPTLVTPLQVVVYTNGVPLALIDNHGNGVFSDQLRSRKIYCLEYATTLNAWVVKRCQLCCTSHVFPQVVIPISVRTDAKLNGKAESKVEVVEA